MFNYAVKKEVIPYSVCNSIDKVAEKARDRKLKDQEIKELYSVLGNDAKDKLIKFLLYTGQRSAECREMVWTELEGDKWIIPAERTKSNTEHLVPLSRQAVKILESIEPQGRFVFSVDGGPLSRYYLPQRFRKINAKFEWEPKATPHDLRRTCKTLMSEMGIRPHVSERVLNHAMKGMEATYDVYTYSKEKRHALQKYADKIDSILGGKLKKGNVINIKSGAVGE